MKSLGINEQDNVTTYFYPHTLRLAEETAKECFKKGADVLLNLYTDRYHESYLTHLTYTSPRKPMSSAVGGIGEIFFLSIEQYYRYYEADALGQAGCI